MTKQIVFRTITEQSKGYGNLNRSITLATALRKLGYDIIFLIDHNINASLELKKRNFFFRTTPKFKSKNYELKYLADLLTRNNWNIIIIDMREFSEKMSKYLEKKNLKTIVLDDAWCKNVYSNIIINGTTTKNFHKYKKINPNAQVYTGPRYWITDENFMKAKKLASEIHRKEKYNIVVSLGGSDPRLLTIQIVNSLLRIDSVIITVIAGPFFNNKFLEKIPSSNRIKMIHSSTRIWTEFHKSDLVISAAGNTLYELCVQGIPTICIPIVKHQIPYAEYFSKKGFSVNLGYDNKINDKTLHKTVTDLLLHYKKRRQMAEASKKIIDGKGLARVVAIIDRFLKLK